MGVGEFRRWEGKSRGWRRCVGLGAGGLEAPEQAGLRQFL